MAGLTEMAALSDLLPPDAPPVRRVRWLRLPRSRRVSGLERIPERYRLQFLLLAADAAKGRPPAEVAALAGRVADRVTVPPGLLAQFAADTRPLDAWFRSQSDRITALTAELAG